MAAALDHSKAALPVNKKFRRIPGKRFIFRKPAKMLALEGPVFPVQAPVTQTRPEKDVPVVAGHQHILSGGKDLDGPLLDQIEGIPYAVVKVGP